MVTILLANENVWMTNGALHLHISIGLWLVALATNYSSSAIHPNFIDSAIAANSCTKVHSAPLNESRSRVRWPPTRGPRCRFDLWVRLYADIGHRHLYYYSALILIGICRLSEGGGHVEGGYIGLFCECSLPVLCWLLSVCCYTVVFNKTCRLEKKSKGIFASWNRIAGQTILLRC